VHLILPRCETLAAEAPRRRLDEYGVQVGFLVDSASGPRDWPTVLAASSPLALTPHPDKTETTDYQSALREGSHRPGARGADL
jgi:hypothetical protein